VGVATMLWRAFDKTVRRKPLAFAADAVDLWELNVGEAGKVNAFPQPPQSMIKATGE